MVFLLSATNSLNTLESLQISLLGMVIVFIVLISLFALIRLLRSITDRIGKPAAETSVTAATAEAHSSPAEKPALTPITAGSAKLHSLDDKTAAMLLAIVADTTNIPINELRVNSIREKKSTPGVGAIEINKKYVFQIGKESTDIMKYNITLNSKVYEVEVERGEAILTSSVAVSAAPTAPVPAAAPSTPSAPSAPIPGGKTVTSPLPGTILNVSVKVGDTVKSGQVLVVIEAMKMENEIPAPCDGRVAQILVSQGASVNTGAALITLE